MKTQNMFISFFFMAFEGQQLVGKAENNMMVVGWDVTK